MNLRKTMFLVAAAVMLFSMQAASQAVDINTIGGFEGALPSYWNIAAQPSVATLTWATDQYRSLGHSLKIVKSATSDTAAWVSDNMCDIWSPQMSANVDILLGAYVKTVGVNTSPSTNDQKWYIAYSFYDSAGTFIGQTKLPIDQSVATSHGWVADTNTVGATTLPRAAWKLIVSFVGGKNATGTVWADDFLFTGRGGNWAGQDWNTSVGVPTGWYYWLPPNGGNDALLSNGFENTVVTSAVSHSGGNSLMFNLPAGRTPHDGFVGTKRIPFGQLSTGTINAGDILRVSVWIKASNLVPDSAAKYPGTWAVGFTPLWFAKYGNNDGYSNVGPGNDYTFTFPPVTSFDWTQYSLDIQVPTGVGAAALETRLHVYSTFTGTVYFDDLTITKLDVPEIGEVGGFEQTLPSFWNIGHQPGGSTLTWATDQFRSMGHSLKIVKTATGDTAAWISSNMCDIWSPQISKNVDILLGAYVKTSGVNTNPSADSSKWYIAYTFYDSAGTLIGQTKLPINQSVASSSGWVADTNAVGATSLPRVAWKLIISFVGGKSATGTVWADDFILTGRGGQWAGQDWNTSVGVPTGWYYWLPPIGGNDGALSNGFENTVVTNEASHTGQYSLKFNMPAGRTPHDGFVGTKRYAINYSGAPPSGVASSGVANRASDISALQGIQPGDMLRVAVWIKASNLVPDSAAKYPGTWAVGITPLWFAKYGNNDGYNNVGPGNDYTFAFPPVTSFDWTQYSVDIQVPAGVNVAALEARLHVYSTFTGTVYFDDLTITKLSVPQISTIGDFEQTLPSYWNIGKQPGGSTLTWATDQSRSMGHSLKITKTVTSDTAEWVSDNMCDIWSPQMSANVDILLGAYVKTSGVNTSPSTDDQKWYIAYTFYDSAGTLIGQTKLPIDQNAATSSGWIADTNFVGATSLPRAAWKLIVSFVGGKNATGTVWAGDFLFTGRGGQWAGQDWNTSVGVPTGWYYWLPPNGGNDALLSNGFENTKVTNAASHSGANSLMFNMPAGRTPHDGFVGTKRFPLGATSINEGDIVRLSVWIKASGLVPDSAAKYPGTWAVGFTPLWFAKYGNNDGYNNVGPGNDYTFTFPHETAFDWTQYTLDVVVPAGVGVAALETRLHVYSTFVGTVYFDDLTVEKIGASTAVKGANSIPQVFELSNNYPNPFNPSTKINYGIPKDGMVSLVVYNVLGQQVRTLVNAPMTAGQYSLSWDGRNDAGSTLSSGVYFYRLQAGSMAIVKKMLLLK